MKDPKEMNKPDFKIQTNKAIVDHVAKATSHYVRSGKQEGPHHCGYFAINYMLTIAKTGKFPRAIPVCGKLE